MLARLRAHLEQFQEPYSQQSLQSLGAVEAFRLDDGVLFVGLRMGFPLGPYAEALQSLIIDHFSGFDLKQITVSMQVAIKSHVVQPGLKPVTGVKNIIAVSSAKGGVGKSCMAINLALALKRLGAEVGLLDGDIYGPSQPHMLGTKEAPRISDNKLHPVLSHGLQSMSIGYLLDGDGPLSWRGPMVSRALQQLIQDTLWSGVDYLVVDLPPGTGDVQLTLAQKIPVSGAVIVTTPQPIACIDALKGLKMFRKIELPVLGIIENMAQYVCPSCQDQQNIFGSGGADVLCRDHQVRLLGRVPLDPRLREYTDTGDVEQFLTSHPMMAERFSEIALTCVAELATRQKTYASKFPEIVIENN